MRRKKNRGPRAFIPRPGDQYRVIYLEDGKKKHKDFTGLQRALDFYSLQGRERATLWILTVSGNVKAQLDMTAPYIDQVERLG